MQCSAERRGVGNAAACQANTSTAHRALTTDPSSFLPLLLSSSPPSPMPEPAYPAARAVAATIEAFFARLHAGGTDLDGERPAPLPEGAAVQAMVDAAFWASLRREEGVAPKISLAYLPPEAAGKPMTFGRAVALTPVPLTRLAPAVERPGIHLGVWPGSDGTLRVWGTTRALPPFCLVLEVVQPGLLVVKYRRADAFAKFGNVAVLDGDRVNVVDPDAGRVPDCPTLVSALIGAIVPPTDGSRRDGDGLDALVQLAASMRAHGRGGSLMVVPHGAEAWRASLLYPTYPIDPPFDALAALVRERPEDGDDRAWQQAFRRAVDAVAGLTAVDGATILTDQYELLAFGAKLRRASGKATVERVRVTEPVVGNRAASFSLGDLGGTRHSSAAQFAHDQPDALAMVASQDGRFTLFAWAPDENHVHAHRVEALLL